MTKDEALRMALEALENSDKLINGSGNHFGLEGAMDGYYRGCFDIDGNNKLLNEAITAIKKVLAQPQRTWVGLTDEEVNDLYNEGMGIHATIEATEAKLRSKNT